MRHIQVKHCIRTERMFLRRTKPPQKNASPGVMSSTRAELASIQAVSPESISRPSCPRAVPDSERHMIKSSAPLSSFLRPCWFITRLPSFDTDKKETLLVWRTAPRAREAARQPAYATNTMLGGDRVRHSLKIRPVRCLGFGLPSRCIRRAPAAERSVRTGSQVVRCAQPAKNKFPGLEPNKSLV